MKCEGLSNPVIVFIFYNNSGDFVTMSHLSCCGMQFANKFSLRRHTNTKHRAATPTFRCYVEDSLRRFKTSATLKKIENKSITFSNFSGNIFTSTSTRFLTFSIYFV